MKKLMTAKMRYVLLPIFAKAGGVTMTTIKLKIQFAVVEMAFAGARMDNGVSSDGISQVIPSQPMAKKVLKRKSMEAAAMPMFR